MAITRHRTDYWIKNDLVDVSIKDIVGPVAIHWHEFYEIELILEGAGIYNIDGIDYPIEKGSLFVMSPSSFHRIVFTENTRLINFMFTLEACEPSFLGGMFDALPHFTMKLSQSDIDFFHLLAKDMTETPSVKHLSVMMNCILSKTQRAHGIESALPQQDGMQYAVLYIQNHFRENLQLGEVAKIANYSTNYFGNKFKEYTGVTFKAYIANLQFALAESMLAYSDLSVSEICYSCGFTDFSNFMTYFKKRHGVPPKEYRRRKQATPS